MAEFGRFSATQGFGLACLCSALAVTACSSTDDADSTGTGGATGMGGAGGGTGGSLCEGATNMSDGSAPLIDDMEDGDLNIIEADSRMGTWSSFIDPSGEPVTEVMAEAITDGEDGSTMALHFAAGGTTTWGAGIGLTFYAPGCYDVNAYTGVRFRAKGRAMLRFQFLQASTHESYDCDMEGGEECSNHYFVEPDVPLTDSWQTLEYRWDEMAQPSWGPRKDLTLDQGVGVAFSHIFDPGSADENYKIPDPDYWIDDVEFLTE